MENGGRGNEKELLSKLRKDVKHKRGENFEIFGQEEYGKEVTEREEFID